MKRTQRLGPLPFSSSTMRRVYVLLYIVRLAEMRVDIQLVQVGQEKNANGSSFESVEKQRSLPVGGFEQISGTTGLAVVIAHNPKAGGSSLKVMTRSMCVANDWNCDEFKPTKTWHRINRDNRSPLELGTVENWFKLSPDERSNTRVVLSAMPKIFFGVCDALPRPCVYVTTMRAPLDQFWSSYHYLCILGMEDRMRWTEAQKIQGYCDTPLIDWDMPDICLRLGMDYRQALLGQVEPAVAALEHPCMWTLDTGTLDQDIERMVAHFPHPWNLATEHIAHTNVHKSESKNVTTSLEDVMSYYDTVSEHVPPSVAAKLLNTTLAPHSRCYAAYRSLREATFQRPLSRLVTC